MHGGTLDCSVGCMGEKLECELSIGDIVCGVRVGGRGGAATVRTGDPSPRNPSP